MCTTQSHTPATTAERHLSSCDVFNIFLFRALPREGAGELIEPRGGEINSADNLEKFN